MNRGVRRGWSVARGETSVMGSRPTPDSAIQQLGLHGANRRQRRLGPNAELEARTIGRGMDKHGRLELAEQGWPGVVRFLAR